MNAFSDEMVIAILTVLTKCSMPDLVKLFDFPLQQAKAKALDTDTHEGSTFEQVEIIMSQTIVAYHSLCTVRRKYDVLINDLKQRIRRR